MSPRQPIKLSDLDKSGMKHGGLLNKYLCKKKIQISLMTWQKLSISTFLIISLWELKVAIATRVLIRPEIKNATYVEANVLSMFRPSFGFIPHMVSEKKIFKHFYEN